MLGVLPSCSGVDAEHPKRGDIMVKKAYKKPALRRLGLLRQITRFSF